MTCTAMMPAPRSLPMLPVESLQNSRTRARARARKHTWCVILATSPPGERIDSLFLRSKAGLDGLVREPVFLHDAQGVALQRVRGITQCDSPSLACTQPLSRSHSCPPAERRTRPQAALHGGQYGGHGKHAKFKLHTRASAQRTAVMRARFSAKFASSLACLAASFLLELQCSRSSKPAAMPKMTPSPSTSAPCATAFSSLSGLIAFVWCPNSRILKLTSILQTSTPCQNALSSATLWAEPARQGGGPNNMHKQKSCEQCVFFRMADAILSQQLTSRSLPARAGEFPFMQAAR